jgi:hypothetical protein
MTNISLGYTVFVREQNTRTVEMLFYQSSIHHLGHVIFDEGIIVDRVKEEAISEWSELENVPEVCNFMGLA